ncbi:hypothetical protein NEOLEDRAFT_1151462 [Neolentinus lepideus HHB14362 ss-1]|uniref:Cytochrome c domain-containing protein n=1 Tax=Neolentinus lepideus HHB14362 ss-1 TaxID=1314782 RepID=A0A165NY60_9AGAM|nr:hypothetical protein NEOLEDRAFT_1151462 [Neolentinus lepideus HHB14362 ss-1]
MQALLSLVVLSCLSVVLGVPAPQMSDTADWWGKRQVSTSSITSTSTSLTSFFPESLPCFRCHDDDRIDEHPRRSMVGQKGGNHYSLHLTAHECHFDTFGRMVGQEDDEHPAAGSLLEWAGSAHNIITGYTHV